MDVVKWWTNQGIAVKLWTYQSFGDFDSGQIVDKLYLLVDKVWTNEIVYFYVCGQIYDFVDLSTHVKPPHHHMNHHCSHQQTTILTT